MVVSGAASKLETQDLVSVIASSLTGPRVRMLVSCCSPFLAGLRFRTECLLGRYLYLFPMRRRFQSGACPFPCCNWFHSEWGDTVWPTLLSSCGTSLHSPNTHLEKCH